MLFLFFLIYSFLCLFSAYDLEYEEPHPYRWGILFIQTSFDPHPVVPDMLHSV
jgi:hypothetical protein